MKRTPAGATIEEWYTLTANEGGGTLPPYTGGATDGLESSTFHSGGSLARVFGHSVGAFGVTRGDQHTLVFANAAFRSLLGQTDEALLGTPIAAALGVRDISGLTSLLDRTLRTGAIARNCRIGSADMQGVQLSCTVWPEMNARGDAEHLVIELHAATRDEVSLTVQRELAERLLLSALREQDAADVSERSRRSAAFVAAEGRRLFDSLDEGATLIAMESMSLSCLGDWCVVDTLGDDDVMHRLAIIHPDPAKQELLNALEGRWIPETDDTYGLPATMRIAIPTVINGDAGTAVASAIQDPEVVRVLREVEIGSLLTVPLVARHRLLGAVTFICGQSVRHFTAEDVEMAEALAARSAMALERARLYGEAVTLRKQAESANDAKSAFLGMMSHELRTPLNAIGGYVDLIDLEVRGPVTEEQHVDLGRIRSSQRYLMSLINDLLNFTKVDSGRLDYDVRNVVVRDVLASSVAIVEPLFVRRGLTCDIVVCDTDVVISADPEKVTQILVNLLSNAIKFTPAGGRLVIGCEAMEFAVLMRVSDTGIGIPPDKLEAIFEAFVQIKEVVRSPEAGIGLGLAISRNLARGMHGDLTVESTFGVGSRFTLTLPRASTAIRMA